MIDKVLKTIKKHNLIEKGEGLVVGVSGGPDSICLLHVLNSLASGLETKIYAVHVNHMLRGTEADADERYVREFCLHLNIPFFSASCDIRRISEEKHISHEEAGREARYHEFESVAISTGSAKIAVAHNRNDQAETVLMHIIRGSGLDGLRGMDYKRGKVIRPLLDIPREEIEEYCTRENLNPRVDRSNLETLYTRNKVRLELIPYIDRLLNTDIKGSICRLASLVRDDGDFMEKCARDAYESCVRANGKNETALELSRFKGFHAALRKRILRIAIEEIKGDIKGIESIHIEAADDLAINGRTGAMLDLPQGIRVGKTYDTCTVSSGTSPEKPPEFCRKLEVPGVTVIDEAGISLEAAVEYGVESCKRHTAVSDDSRVQYFDYDQLGEGINIRNRRNGDIFKPLRSNGSKKLKEYFIDKKVPRLHRDKIPLLAKDGEVAWIIGYKISDKFKVTENTKRVLKLKII